MNIRTDVYLRRATRLAELITAVQQGETLESYDFTRELWVEVIDDNFDACVTHFLSNEAESFWDLRVAPKPKPKPKIPYGVFWVRLLGNKDAWLVTDVTSDGNISGTGRVWTPRDDLVGYEWSRDRKTWYKFMETGVSS